MIIEIQWFASQTGTHLLKHRYSLDKKGNHIVNAFEDLQWSDFTGTYESCSTLIDHQKNQIERLQQSIIMLCTRIYELGLTDDVTPFKKLDSIKAWMREVDAFLKHRLKTNLNEHVFKSYTKHFIQSEINGVNIHFEDLNNKLFIIDDLALEVSDFIRQLELTIR